MDYPNQSPNYVETPTDYKVWSIVNIVLSILCCSCCGIIGLVLSIMALLKSNEVTTLMAQGNAMQAQEASGKAKLYNIIASIFVGISLIFNIIGFFFGFFNSLLEGSSSYY